MAYCFASFYPSVVRPHGLGAIPILAAVTPPCSSALVESPIKLPSSILSPKCHLSSTMAHSLLFVASPLPTLAASDLPFSPDEASDKINLESILIAIDDFNNRNPFFVAGVMFIWLVVTPVVKYYLSKCKYVSAIDSFRRLRDDPSAQLLDIRDKKSVAVLPSPNLKILGKSVVQVQFSEEDADVFVERVKERFTDPENTVLFILDNFDGNSLKAAGLLFKDGGFKEAYAIKGGVGGKKGWKEIQESLLPPSVHMFRRKKGKKFRKDMNGAATQPSEDTIGMSTLKSDA